MTAEIIEIIPPFKNCEKCRIIKAEEIQRGQMLELRFTESVIQQLKLHNESYGAVAGIADAVRYGEKREIYSVILENTKIKREFLISGIAEIILRCPTCAVR